MIRIAQRFRPFTHTPGRSAPVPGSSWIVTAYPTRLLFTQGKEQHVVTWELGAPLEHFTFLLDLERGLLRLFGRTKLEYFALEIEHGPQLDLRYAKGPCRNFFLDGVLHPLQPKQALCISPETSKPQEVQERLALGCHKKQEIDRIIQRSDLCEMLPFLFYMGQMYPKAPPLMLQSADEGLSLCRAHFRDLWVPQIEDANYQGYKNIIPAKLHAHDLWSAAYQGIRALFIQEDESGIHILPHKFSQLHSGRLLRAQCKDLIIDMHWTKKCLFKVQIEVLQDTEVQIVLPPSVRAFRCKTRAAERGIVQDAKVPMQFKKHTRYFLDKFTR